MKEQLKHHHQTYENSIYFESNQLMSLYSGEDIQELAFNRVKADTMMLTAHAHIRQHDIYIKL